jgi:hypothetical protein
MLQKFTVEKKNKILWCIKDNLETYQSGWAREVSINITDFILNRMFVNSCDIYISNDEDEMLSAAAKDGFYSHAVVVACGTSFKLSERIFSAVEEQCKNDFFVAGHVLDRTNHSYYKNAGLELHHQFYIVNLQDYRNLGLPQVGQETWEEYSCGDFIRSEECLYEDKEIPQWVKKGTTEKIYSMKLHGWNIINSALENNRPLVDLGEGIRNNKRYFYYEHDHVFCKQLSNLYYDDFFCHTVFAPFNSDPLLDKFFVDQTIEQYVTVSIGLNWIKYAEKINNPNLKIVFTDINFHCLKFMKTMVEEWDGKDYVELFRNYMRFQPNLSMLNVDTGFENWYNDWNRFQSNFEDWNKTWNFVKSLKFDYVLIDYTANYEFSWIEKEKNTLINFSDLFNHAPFIFTHPAKYRISAENKLIQTLKNHDPEIYAIITSRAADGFWNEDPPVRIGKVKDFVYTDINKLKKPIWHEKDWFNSGCRPLGVD